MVTALACFACFAFYDSTPEATVNGVIDGINKHDWKAVFSRFEDAKLDQVVAQFEKLNGVPNAIPKFSVKIESLPISGDTAKGKVTISSQMNGTPTPEIEDEVQLHLTKGDWKVVGGSGKNSLFSQLAMIAKSPEKMQGSRDAATRTVILSNLKQLALGVMLYTDDHDDKMTLDQASLKKKLAAYLKNEKTWSGPDGKLLDVQFNPNLVGKSLASVAEPANTVLLSLGTKDKLQMFGNETPIAFVDGHCRYMAKEALGKLKWK